MASSPATAGQTYIQCFSSSGFYNDPKSWYKNTYDGKFYVILYNCHTATGTNDVIAATSATVTQTATATITATATVDNEGIGSVPTVTVTVGAGAVPSILQGMGSMNGLYLIAGLAVVAQLS